LVPHGIQNVKYQLWNDEMQNVKYLAIGAVETKRKQDVPGD
jgi:hypothetical protein